jgi:DNA modification methylase
MFTAKSMSPIAEVDACAPEPSRGVGRSRRPALPREVAVKRSDAIYNAHSYLTKVPVSAIEPFLEAFTQPGETVLDMFGGSGMTGLAAAMLGRRAEIRDISVLGRHIGESYLSLVDEGELRDAGREAVDAARRRLGDVYAVRCDCGKAAQLSRTVWSYVYECGECGAPVSYYEAYEAAEWEKKEMACGRCGEAFSARQSRRVGEAPVLDTVVCECSPKLREQPHSEPPAAVALDGLSYPDVAIDEDRQMFQASALRKNGLETVASFFSERNLAVLAALREAIDAGSEEPIRGKLMFAFTAILARASKRYQWHPKRPLNAAGQHYYIAPVFYEWNVYELFGRKVEAAIRSDRQIRERIEAHGGAAEVSYEIGSADAIDLPDESVDYVFTDPPFGSNLFYSDMNLFQEAWLGAFTDHEREAVVDRSGNGERRRTAERYEELIAASLAEAHRVLRPGGWISLVFSSSRGGMWALLQRSIAKAGFEIGEVTLLSKGQRSVKGLTSGFENVVTADLVISMQKTSQRPRAVEPRQAPAGSLRSLVGEILSTGEVLTPSHVYLGVIRRYLQRDWSVADLDVKDVIVALADARYDVEATSGRLVKASAQAA